MPSRVTVWTNSVAWSPHQVLYEGAACYHRPKSEATRRGTMAALIDRITIAACLPRQAVHSRVAVPRREHSRTAERRSHHRRHPARLRGSRTRRRPCGLGVRHPARPDQAHPAAGRSARLILISTGNLGNDELERRLFEHLAEIQHALMAGGFVELAAEGLVVHGS